MRLLKFLDDGRRVRLLKPRRGTLALSFVGFALQTAQSGEQGCPEAVGEAELELDEPDEFDSVVVIDVDGGEELLDVFELSSDDLDRLSSSSLGSLGSSVLSGLLGSLGSLPDPVPSLSPPPPGGQKGHIHEEPWMPSPPVPPFHQLPPGPTIMTAADTVN